MAVFDDVFVGDDITIAVCVDTASSSDLCFGRCWLGEVVGDSSSDECQWVAVIIGDEVFGCDDGDDAFFALLDDVDEVVL